jgi:carboxypeptidase family protein
MLSMKTVLAGALLLVSTTASAQTGATGALQGVVTDPSGGRVAKATVLVTSAATGETRNVETQADGSYSVPLLPPGEYEIAVTTPGFEKAVRTGVRVTVTETANVPIQLSLQGVADTVQVTAGAELVQTESPVLGRVADARIVEGLPLVTRNFTQIIGLSPGVTAEVTNAGELGRGSGGTGGVFTHGDRSYDNNFQMNGLGVNDIFAQGTTSGGVPIPNPDTILEFKVQTGQYDAAFGRNAGANVNLVTRSGTNELRGTVFEFFRDRSLNANDFFAKRNHQPKPALDQNQFGFTVGGPIVPSRVLFFGAYQGTRQTNGVASVRTVLSPALTDDRSAGAIGRLFAGQRGVMQNAMGGVGPAILADGSNINPVALALLQMRLSNGQYLLPTPQTLNPSAAFAVQGSSTFSTPSTFDEDQFMANVDWVHTDASRFAGRLFVAPGSTVQAFPSGNIAGFPLTTDDRYIAASVNHSWVLGPTVVNEARFGYGLLETDRSQQPAFTFSGIGITSSPLNDELPTINITGSFNMASSAVGKRSQKTFLFEDSVSWIRGSHNIQLGGGFTRALRDFSNFRQPGQIIFQSFPDFLLGLNRTQNGTNLFSNIITSVDLTGLFDRASRNWELSGYMQDSLHVSSRLTLNLGLRYEFLPPLTDDLGRPTTIDADLLDPNPPAAGSLAGIVVAGNYPGDVPAAVTKTDTDSVIDRANSSTWAPRLGAAWKLLGESSRIVLRGGYGVYYSRTTGQVQTQTTTTQPFGLLRISAGPPNGLATFANPFPAPIPTEASFPAFVPYTPTSNQTANAVDRALEPGRVQQFSGGVQMEVAPDLMVEAAYVGSRGDKLQRLRGINQALLATPQNPIRGVTTNTVGNIASRKPFLGWSSSDLRRVESAADTQYDALETSLTKRYSHGLQFLASYTWSRTIDSEGANTDGNAQAAGGFGNQNDEDARRGPANFSRPHRFIASFVYELPWMKSGSGVAHTLAGGWTISGVATFQSGRPLTLTGNNANNAYGYTMDRAQLAAGCSNDDLATSGSVKSRLNGFFNTACVGPSVRWPVIGSDGQATDFGNSGVGVVRGPAQSNLDIAFVKRTSVPWPGPHATVDFRAELFNAFNSVQFANPDTTVTNSTFGLITSTSVSPRVIQLALKLNF